MLLTPQELKAQGLKNQPRDLILNQIQKSKIDEDYGAIDSLEDDEMKHRWFPVGIFNASKCLNCGTKVLNDEQLKEANEVNCEPW